MTVELAGQHQGTIHHVDHHKQRVSIIEITNNQHDHPVLSHNVIKVNFGKITQIIPINEI